MGYDSDAIKRSVLLSDVAANEGGKLFRNGREYVGLCPFHAEKTPSFQIFVGDGGIRFIIAKAVVPMGM